MEGLIFFVIMIAIVVRSVKKQKKQAQARQAASKQYTPPPQAFEGEGPPPSVQRHAPVQQRIPFDETPRLRQDAAARHRHVEQINGPAFAGEGDAARYNEREVSCETVGHEEKKAALSMPKLNRENLLSAVVFSEVLSKPKALQQKR